MATKGYDSTSAHHHSSIALLQERFRQLQRAKEMRKEKELLRLFTEPERNNTINHNPATKRSGYESKGLLFHPESLLPHHHHHSIRAQPSHHHQSSIYLQPNLQSKQGFQGGETGPMFANYTGPTGSSMNSHNRTYNFDDYSDVDTSLHL